MYPRSYVFSSLRYPVLLIFLSAFVSFSIAGQLIYSTYLGGSNYERGSVIAVDTSENAYLTGWTYSADFPTTTGAFDTIFNGGTEDAYVSKLNATGTILLYSTLIGGISDDRGNSITVDNTGNAYITGSTGSPDFPITIGAFDTVGNGAFITKLNPTGTAPIFSTLFSGNPRGIAVDTAGNIYISGYTGSNFPTTPGAYDTTFNGGTFDAFVSKLNSTGSALIYSTFIGGTSMAFGDLSQGIAVDNNGNAYITGWTNSTNYPTTDGAYDTTFNGGYDSFVSKLNATGSALSYSTYLGGNGKDMSFGIAVDTSENAYIIGWTTSSTFPTTPGAFDTTFNGGYYDVFVSKLNAAGSALVYSTFIGGSNDDLGNAIAVDHFGNAYITGFTQSTDFQSTLGAYDISPYSARTDAFVSILNAAGSQLYYSTYLGGSDYDFCYGIAVDNAGIVYLTGVTSSSDFPVTFDAFDTTYNGAEDAIVVKLNPVPMIEQVSFSDVNMDNIVDQGDTLTVQFPRPMRINSATPSDFYLPVTGDSFGSGAIVSLNTILNSQVIITLGSSPVLTIPGVFSINTSSSSSPSGLDISASMTPDAIEDVNGLDARDGGIRGVNDSGLDIKYTLQPRTVFVPFKFLQAYSEITIQIDEDAFNNTYTKHKLIIPSGSNKTPADITIGKPGDNHGRLSAVALTPASMTFSNQTPATLVVQYLSSDINAADGYVGASMRIHQWNPNTQRYEPIPETLSSQVVDPVAGTVSVKIDRFDMLGVAGGNTTIVYANIALPTVGATTTPVAPATFKRYTGGIDSPSLMTSTSITISVTPVGIYTKHRITLLDYLPALSGITVTISQPTFLETQGWPPEPSIYSPNHAILKLKVTGGVITTQSILTMEYKDRDDPDGKYTNDVHNGVEVQMRIYRWINGGWSIVPGTQLVNRIDNTVTVTLSSLSTSQLYAVGIDPTAAPVAVDYPWQLYDPPEGKF